MAKKYWREILIVILIAVVYFSVNTCQRNSSNVNLLRHTQDTSFTSIKYFRNKSNQLVSEVKMNEVTISQLKKFGENLGIDNKKLRKEIGSLNNLVGYWRGQLSIVDSVTVTNIDTIYLENGNIENAKYFEFKNPYLEVDGITTANQTHLNYNYNVDFSMIAYRKKQGLFKRSQLVSDLSFADPNITVREFKGLIIIEPKKKWYETRGFAFLLGYIARLATSQ